MRAYDMETACAPSGEDWRWFTREELRQIPLAGEAGRHCITDFGGWS